MKKRITIEKVITYLRTKKYGNKIYLQHNTKMLLHDFVLTNIIIALFAIRYSILKCKYWHTQIIIFCYSLFTRNGPTKKE